MSDGEALDGAKKLGPRRTFFYFFSSMREKGAFLFFLPSSSEIASLAKGAAAAFLINETLFLDGSPKSAHFLGCVPHLHVRTFFNLP